MYINTGSNPCETHLASSLAGASHPPQHHPEDSNGAVSAVSNSVFLCDDTSNAHASFITNVQ